MTVSYSACVSATIEGFIQTLHIFIRFSNNIAAVTSTIPYSNHAATEKHSVGFLLI